MNDIKLNMGARRIEGLTPAAEINWMVSLEAIQDLSTLLGRSTLANVLGEAILTAIEESA
jgi:hypothetical protein